MSFLQQHSVLANRRPLKAQAAIGLAQDQLAMLCKTLEALPALLPTLKRWLTLFLGLDSFQSWGRGMLCLTANAREGESPLFRLPSPLMMKILASSGPYLTEAAPERRAAQQQLLLNPRFKELNRLHCHLQTLQKGAKAKETIAEPTAMTDDVDEFLASIGESKEWRLTTDGWTRVSNAPTQLPAENYTGSGSATHEQCIHNFRAQIVEGIPATFGRILGTWHKHGVGGAGLCEWTVNVVLPLLLARRDKDDVVTCVLILQGVFDALTSALAQHDDEGVQDYMRWVTLAKIAQEVAGVVLDPNGMMGLTGPQQFRCEVLAKASAQIVWEDGRPCLAFLN